MFNIFKKGKPKLSDIIPYNFVDIHSHILPGIDDGAKNLTESYEMINEMKMLGFSKIIGTPHTISGLYDNTNEIIKSSFLKIKTEKINDVVIDYASEYMIEPELIYKAENKNLLTLKKKFVLTEMSFIQAPKDLYEILFIIQTNGYKPIIAHPERYLYFSKDFSDYEKLKNIGCKFQLNLLSSVGYYGPDVLKITNKLLKNNFIDYVGSDIHSIKHINFIKKNKLRISEIDKLKYAINQNQYFM